MSSEATESPQNDFYVQEAYLMPLPYINMTATCNCVKFARQLGVGDRPIDEPILLGGVITRDGATGHIAVVIRIEEDSIIIIEANYIACALSVRRIYLDDSKIIRFVY